jgi:hypothetical protein
MSIAFWQRTCRHAGLYVSVTSVAEHMEELGEVKATAAAPDIQLNAEINSI